MNDQPTSLLERRRATMVTALTLFLPRIRALFVTGGILVVLGSISLAAAMLASRSSLTPIGIFMIIAGLFELGLGHLAREEDGPVTPWMQSGGGHMVAGFFALVSPLVPSAVLTTVLGGALTFAGLSWLRAGFALPQGFQSPVVMVSGGFTALVGLLILSRWPIGSQGLMAIMLGCEILVRGWSWVGFAAGISKAAARNSKSK